MLVCLSNSETKPASLLTLVTEGLNIKKVVSVELGSSVEHTFAELFVFFPFKVAIKRWIYIIPCSSLNRLPFEN